MSLYLIQKQSGELLDKQLCWTGSVDASLLFKTPHKDVALNQLIELNARDITLRATVVSCDTDGKGLPILTEALASAC